MSIAAVVTRGFNQSVGEVVTRGYTAGAAVALVGYFDHLATFDSKSYTAGFQSRVHLAPAPNFEFKAE